VKAENDYVHVNCATPFKMAEDTLLACCLFHPNEVVFLNLETKHIVNTLEGVGESIHSAWILDDTLFVCSSAESKIRKLALTSGELLWEWTAPGKAWTRSAKLIDAETLVFTAEREREAPDSEFLGYAGCLNVKTGEMQWKLGLPTEGPFDIEPFDPLR
jgi:outer membrane protein assembly factor BamB